MTPGLALLIGAAAATIIATLIAWRSALKETREYLKEHPDCNNLPDYGPCKTYPGWACGRKHI